MPEPSSDTSSIAIRDRAIGSLLGPALGDALGTTLEFRAPDTYARLMDMIGGGPFSLAAGEWTDDTSMALADSLAYHLDLDLQDLMQRFAGWYRKGRYSHNGRCFDISITTRQAIGSWERTGEPLAGSVDPMSAGKGSLMHFAPVAIHHHVTRQICAIWRPAKAGSPMQHSKRLRPVWPLRNCWPMPSKGAAVRGAGKAPRVFRRGWSGLGGRLARQKQDKGPLLRLCGHRLNASLWSVGALGGFSGAVLRAANLGDGADTVAAVTGQLVGALAGAEALPQA